MTQMLLNSGFFESLDAAAHWANRVRFSAGVYEIEQHDLVQVAGGYRVFLRAMVTNEYAAAERQRVLESGS